MTEAKHDAGWLKLVQGGGNANQETHHWVDFSWQDSHDSKRCHIERNTDTLLELDVSCLLAVFVQGSLPWQLEEWGGMKQHIVVHLKLLR